MNPEKRCTTRQSYGCQSHVKLIIHLLKGMIDIWICALFLPFIVLYCISRKKREEKGRKKERSVWISTTGWRERPPDLTKHSRTCLPTI